MVAIYGNDKDGGHVEYVGFPEEFDWQRLAGVTLVAHNASFDGLVYNRLLELGKINGVASEWVCTADLAAFLRVPRNLKGAAFQLLGVTMSKAVRASMDGVKYREQTLATQAEWREYAGLDAALCFKIHEKFGPEWPAQERMISKNNRAAGWRGVAVDRERLDDGFQKLFATLQEAEKLLPWVAEGEKAGSANALRRHARQLGITDVPASLKKDNPEMVAWVEANREKYPFIQARLTHASCTPHYARLRSMRKLLDDNNVIRFDVLYHGTNTGRVAASSAAKSGVESVDGKFNPLNIPKYPVFGVDIRGMLVPRPGYKFMIYDYAQVEARIVQWLAGATKFIDLLLKEGNIYQAAAKQLGWFPADGVNLRKVDHDLYDLSKATTLGAGFGMSGDKFYDTCVKKGMSIVKEKAIGAIQTWREKNSEVVGYWRYHQDQINVSAVRRDPVHIIRLPSGRKLTYFNPIAQPGTMLYRDKETGKMVKRDITEILASTVKGGEPTRLYGGKLTENVVQATARDVMYCGANKISEEHPDWFYMWNAYDEVIFEVPDCDVKLAEERIPLHLTTAATWAKGCPLEVNGGPCDRYMKD
jgi:DNA polymerase